MSEPRTGRLLHIFLLTYNREASFRRTLEQIAGSGLKEIPLTVMDNCSTDGTPAVCEEFRARLPQMEVCRHERNMGFGANFLRSIELSRGEYTWVLCDDDTLFPERVPALLAMLATEGPEAVFVGGPRQDEWPAGEKISPAEIQRKYRTFLTGQSFVPAIVFKSSLVTSLDLVDGYFGIATNFPQLILGRKLLVNDIPCGLIRPPVLRRDDPGEKARNYLTIIEGWSEFCRTLPPPLRRDAFYSTFGRPDMIGMIQQTLRMILWAKIEGGSDPGYHVARIGLNCGFQVRAGLLICRVACFLPGGLFNLARKAYRKVKYGWLGRPLPPNYHAAISQDDLLR